MRNRGSRAVAAGALALTAFLSCVLVVTDGGRLAYNTRETTALWLEWASTLAPLGRRACRSGSEDAKARLPATSASGPPRSRGAWLARSLAGVDALRDRGRLADAVVTACLHLRGDDRGRRRLAAARVGGACWRPPPSSTCCAAWPREPRALAVQVIAAPASRAGRLLEMLPLEPVVARRWRRAGPQRSDDCGSAGGSCGHLSCAGRGRRYWRLADARHRAGSVCVAERSDCLAGAADRDRRFRSTFARSSSAATRTRGAQSAAWSSSRCRDRCRRARA